MMTTVRVAARPGVFSGSLVSSFIVRVTSHPQKMKIDSERPATTALKDPTANGLNHASSIGLASNALPCATCTSAATEKITSTSTWNPTRTYCSFCVVCMSRYDTKVAPSMNSRHTATLMNGLKARSAISGLPVIWAISRKRNSTAMPARFESTRMVAAMRPQPASHPTHGPNARDAQVNEVPASGIARLSSR